MDEKSKKDADDSSETVVEEKVVETELVDEESTTEQITPCSESKTGSSPSNYRNRISNCDISCIYHLKRFPSFETR